MNRKYMYGTDNVDYFLCINGVTKSNSGRRYFEKIVRQHAASIEERNKTLSNGYDIKFE